MGVELFFGENECCDSIVEGAILLFESAAGYEDDACVFEDAETVEEIWFHLSFGCFFDG